MSDDVKHVSGRRAMLQALDTLWGVEDNIRKVAAAAQEHLDEHPLEHLKTFIMPLLPKQIEVEATTIDTEEVARQLKEMDSTNVDPSVG